MNDGEGPKSRRKDFEKTGEKENQESADFSQHGNNTCRGIWKEV